MQESFSEITLAELPLVIFNMARGQQDYFQATRGGGHGDYRHIVLAPQDVREGVEHVQLAFHLADKWRNPVLIYGDYLLAHTQEAISIEPIAFPELPEEGLGGRRHADRHRATAAASRRSASPSTASPRWAKRARRSTSRTKIPFMEREAARRARLLRRRRDRHRRVRFAGQVREVRDQAAARRRSPHRLRPADHALAVPLLHRRRRGGGPNVRRVGSFELSAGQLVEDVRIGVAGRAPVTFIGGVSTDQSGFGVGRILDVELISERILALHEDRELPLIPGYEQFSYQIQEHQK